MTRVRACALKRFACLREAASAKAGRASVVRAREILEFQLALGSVGFNADEQSAFHLQ